MTMKELLGIVSKEKQSIFRLSDLFDKLTNDRPKMTARVTAAHAEIRKSAQRLIEQAQFRPFGWEDLCA